LVDGLGEVEIRYRELSWRLHCIISGSIASEDAITTFSHLYSRRRALYLDPLTPWFCCGGRNGLHPRFSSCFVAGGDLIRRSSNIIARSSFPLRTRRSATRSDSPNQRTRNSYNNAPLSKYRQGIASGSFCNHIYRCEMLRQAARSPCWRAPARLTIQHPAFPRTRPLAATFRRPQIKSFSDKKQPDESSASDKKTPVPDPSSLPAKPAAPSPPKTQNAATAQKTLLSESTVGRKEQRKADWAIMREMAKYLWPKVEI
jgi:hypothetical protein